ncbi:MAG TPA: hypothetical protein VLC55_09520 [Burkholderiales bacterium]|nr:hypothetical protein [Burkholderiales bacterium]
MLACLALVCCASDVPRHPSVLRESAPTNPAEVITIPSNIVVEVGTSYPRTIKGGSRWIPVGVLREGRVYKSADSVFTLEGAHVHEAYLVIDEDILVGFYLPVEKAFAPMESKPSINKAN